MSLPTLSVLKFGGSVLHDVDDARNAVHEIYRWVRQGHSVLAVVSAFEGHTDALLAKAAQFGTDENGTATAMLVATGELVSAGTLALAAQQAGLTASVLSPHAMGLRTQGAALDAQAVDLDVQRVRDALERFSVVVVPGFVGVDDAGQFTLLGRGGSDLTALFLGQRLKAPHIRLIKDVDALYQWDPATPGPRPQRFASLSWDHALRLGGGVVQPKAIQFARDHGLVFQLGAAQQEGGTVVGPGPEVLQPLAPARRPTHTVALLGLGTVGGGVFAQLQRLSQPFHVCGALARDPARAQALGVDPSILQKDAHALVTGEATVVVEALGGLEPARTLIETALKQGKHVVTANKAVLAQHGVALNRVARAHGVRLLASAAVGGAVPMLEHAALLSRSTRLERLEGVLNATTTFVLDQLAAGHALEEAVAAAQQAGFAEADPSRDLLGLDAADKLVILVERCFGVELDPAEVRTQPLSAETCAAAAKDLGPDQVLRQVAWARRRGTQVECGVELVAVQRSHPLGNLRGAQNGLVLRDATRSWRVVGQGAGRWPTSEAVVADLLDLWRDEPVNTPAKAVPEFGRLPPLRVAHRTRAAQAS